MTKTEQTITFVSKNKNDYNKKCGERLKECRELRGFTQSQLAEKVGFSSSNYISMIERGVRKIDSDKAILFANALNVSYDYIMCKSDHVNQCCIDESVSVPSHVFLIKYISSLGYDIKFNIVKLYEKGQPKLTVTLDKLKNFSFLSANCVLVMNDSESEVIITDVDISNENLSFGEFVFTMHQIRGYLIFLLENIRNTQQDLDTIYSHNFHIKNQIDESSVSEIDIIKTKDLLSAGEPVNIDLGNGICGKAFLRD